MIDPYLVLAGCVTAYVIYLYLPGTKVCRNCWRASRQDIYCPGCHYSTLADE